MNNNTNSISHKLFRGSAAQAREHIQQQLLTPWSVVVSFLYFAQAMKFDLYTNKKSHNNPLRTSYQEALESADMLLIDGIALQLFDRCGQLCFSPRSRSWSKNLNGTDFLPYILNNTKDKKVAIVLSTLYDPSINKSKEWMDRWIQELTRQFPHTSTIFAHQTPYSKRGQDFPFDSLEEILKEQYHDFDYILFLNGISSPSQELWTHKNKEFFERYPMIVLNNGATIDYYSGFEQRAPKRVVKLRVGETLRRVVTQPKKNLHKFLSMFRIVPYRGYLIQQFFQKQIRSWKSKEED